MRIGFAKLRQQLWPSTPSFLVVFVGVCFGFHSNVEMTYIGSTVTLGIAVIWFVAWLLRLLASLRQDGAEKDKVSRPMLSWIIEPAFALVMYAVVTLKGFTWLRFLMSVYFMQSYAENQILAENKNRLVGLFRVHSLRIQIYESKDGSKDGSKESHMQTADQTMTGSAGFTYLHHGGKPRRADYEAIHYDHMYGPWWMWRLDHRSTIP